MTGGSAQEIAAEITSAAMVDRLAPLCLIRFNEDLEKDQKFEALNKVSSWQRRGYVEEQGWATQCPKTERCSLLRRDTDYTDFIVLPPIL